MPSAASCPGTGGPLPFLSRVAVSEPVCEQVLDFHVVIVDVLRHPIGKIPAPVHCGGLVVWCTAEADLRSWHLLESEAFSLIRGRELDIWAVL